MQILYAHHNDSYIKTSASTFSLVASLTSFCNALYLRAVLIRYFLLFPYLYICNHPCFQHLKKRCSPYKIVFTNIHFILYLCILPHTKFSYAIKIENSLYCVTFTKNIFIITNKSNRSTKKVVIPFFVMTQV